MLHIAALKASIDGRAVLDGVDLDVAPGEIHAVMGPNGAGKSTLSNVLTGRDGYTVAGTATLDGADLLTMTPEQRAAAGLFLAFQYPTAIPGVGNMYFLRTALNAIRAARGDEEISAVEFLTMASDHMERLGMDPEFLTRSVNDGFSGGEKKRNEILQMTLLEPRLVILDEIDSGLDVDALGFVADAIERLRSPSRAMVIITHYPRLLELVRPDQVHVLREGRIVRSGDHRLAEQIERDGYGTSVGAAR
jgi:Fe-S cluster assembly ATP-binding protein